MNEKKDVIRMVKLMESLQPQDLFMIHNLSGALLSTMILKKKAVFKVAD